MKTIYLFYCYLLGTPAPAPSVVPLPVTATSKTSEEARDADLGRYTKVQQPLFALLEKSINHLGRAAMADGSAAAVAASASELQAAQQEFSRLVKKFTTLSDLTWTDFVQLTSEEFSDEVPWSSLSLGAKKTLQRLYKKHHQ